MTLEQKDLAALIGSRICHDLISPIGAIGNGLELMSMSGAGASPELSLIGQSVGSASARIGFYRVAFGSTGDGQNMSRQEIVGILDGFTAGTRVSIDWRPAGDLRRIDAKLLFLLLQCCESAMPYGGTLTVNRAEDSWTVEGAATKLKQMEEIWALLTDPAAEVAITPALVQFGLVRYALEDSGRQLQLDLQPDSLRITI